MLSKLEMNKIKKSGYYNLGKTAMQQEAMLKSIMTVGELIDELKKFPRNFAVQMYISLEFDKEQGTRFEDAFLIGVTREIDDDFKVAGISLFGCRGEHLEDIAKF